MKTAQASCAAERSDGKPVRGGIRPERGKQQAPSVCSPFSPPPIDPRSTRPCVHEHRSRRHVHAKQLTSDGATLQSP